MRCLRTNRANVHRSETVETAHKDDHWPPGKQIKIPGRLQQRPIRMCEEEQQPKAGMWGNLLMYTMLQHDETTVGKCLVIFLKEKKKAIW